MAINTDGFGTIVSDLEAGGGGGGGNLPVLTYWPDPSSYSTNVLALHGEGWDMTITGEPTGVIALGYPDEGSGTASGNYTAVLSGRGNDIDGNANLIVGGTYNNIIAMGGPSGCSLIVGGSGNSIQSPGSDYSCIVGGSTNAIYPGSTFCFIGGGESNYVSNGGSYAVITGGSNNTTIGSYGTVSGGYNNHVGNEGASDYSTICGGAGNQINDNVTAGAILGGSGNVIGSSSNYAVVLGGLSNTVTAMGSVAMGLGARAVGASQHAFAGGQTESDGVGNRQVSTYVMRGNTLGEDNNEATTLACGGGVGQDPDTIIGVEGTKSYIIYADVLARRASDGATQMWSKICAAQVVLGSLTVGSAADVVTPQVIGAASDSWEVTIEDIEGSGIGVIFNTGVNGVDACAVVAYVRVVECAMPLI